MIAAGFGFRAGASSDSLADALKRACDGHVPTVFATLENKANDLRGFAKARGLPLIAIAPELAAAQSTLTQSSASLTHTSTGSVAEATALAAAGPNARLIGPRSISTDRMATCAIAIGDT